MNKVFTIGFTMCSEAEPLHCHRRLVAEYFLRKHGNAEIVHR